MLAKNAKCALLTQPAGINGSEPITWYRAVIVFSHTQGKDVRRTVASFASRVPFSHLLVFAFHNCVRENDICPCFLYNNCFSLELPHSLQLIIDVTRRKENLALFPGQKNFPVADNFYSHILP